jgi:Nif-specific regulatory protein
MSPTMKWDAKQRSAADVEVLALYEISKLLTSSPDYRKCVRQVLNLLTGELEMRHALLGMVQDDGKLHIIGASDVPWHEGGAPILDANVGLLAKVLKNGSPIVVPDIASDPDFLNRTGRDLAASAGVAYIAVPLRVDRQIVGVLSVDRHPGSDRPINFERDVRLVTLVANLLAQTWQLHQTLAAERRELIAETHRLQKQLQGKYDIENVIGRSKRMKDVFADVHQVAPSQSTVLLRGESGTGKEAIAHAIHYLSPRSKKPFIKLNCAALPETLLESELFGHEKGAFTGATSERKGRFEQANGGTIFLDEIGDITPAFQAKLLRVLQEREFERVGGSKTIRTDVRIVAATNRNLEEMVQRGEFRGDLYFRLNVVSIVIPPLRERKDDIPLLVDFFLTRFNSENGRRLTITQGAVDVLMQCSWPGNVRELENCIQRAATMTRQNVIRESDMRCQKGQCFSAMLVETPLQRIPVVSPRPGSGQAVPSVPAARARVPEEVVFDPPPVTVPIANGQAGGDDSSADAPDGEAGERGRLIEAMERCGWVQAKAARLLGLTPRQIGYALRKHGIEIKQL